MATPTLTPDIIAAAIEGLEAQKTRIDDKISELRGMLSGSSVTSPAQNLTAHRHTLSPAGRKRIADAQRKRWAAARGKSPAPVVSKKPRLSKEGRAAIVAALKKRWAATKTQTAKAAG